MLFNSFEFILAFLPLTVLLYYLLNHFIGRDSGKILLLLASLFFYGWWNPAYLPLILGSMVINFLIGKTISGLSTGSKQSLLFYLGITFNIGLLVYFKYFNFLIENIDAITYFDFNTLNIVLPLAISFFTFQQIAYLSDSKNGLTGKYNFFNYGLFVSFFPQLIAGPIVHHEEMMPQFADKYSLKVNYNNLSKGLYVFALGLGKKVIVADSFAQIANAGYTSPEILNTLEAWVVSLSYAVQLYFDFSGYSDMAIGAALMFNIKLPINFNSPYKALSIQDFWRRWHMTLSRFLRDYLYISMGGNRRGESKTLRNLFITFLLGGIWHGAGWTFVMWGAMHGAALIVHRVWSKSKLNMPNVLAWFLTFNFVNIAWVFFRANSFNDAVTIVKTMFGFGIVGSGFNVYHNLYAIPVLLIGIVLLFVKNTNQFGDNFKMNFKTMITTASLIMLGFLFMNSSASSEFLYFDF